MAKIDVNTIAKESKSDSYSEFLDKFQENVINIAKREAFETIDQNKEYTLDEDGYILGNVWSEKIASELIDMNGLTATVERINTLIEGRAVFGNNYVPTEHKLIAKALAMSSSEFLQQFPKFPVIYFTRWGNMRKPLNLKELIDNPVKR